MGTGSFNAAAAAYEAARGFPPGVGEQVAQAAVDWIGWQARVLEVGIGTGRIARPLLALGVNVTGLDLSAQMMGQLRTILPAGAVFPALVQGDANRLPFAVRVFDAVVSVHMFQLLADWGQPVSELRRVLRPGGVFLNGYEWRPPDSPGARLMQHWRQLLEAAGQPALAAGARDFSDLKDQLLQTGAAYREQDVGQWTTTRTLARQLETIEHRTWLLGGGEPGGALADCLGQLRSWALAEFGALDQVHSVPHRFIWQCFEWN
jgi:ubiquinone/menaquinone biosynthesis C-methylase UbiE